MSFSVGETILKTKKGGRYPPLPKKVVEKGPHPSSGVPAYCLEQVGGVTAGAQKWIAASVVESEYAKCSP